ncbi:MMPL family transporter [Occultella glacieicola]|uniref:MMPL family transporter n=1 Tax=Occultella glacieicola TaxID=2518684 RepID=A0ABY2E9F3_9MICO|nr:MMPL family transporter [Occultella glacieicola]TDE94927.1 MMPL family transporter [Occultella glacieicola]
MAELLYRLGRFAARRARTVIAVWLAVLVLAGGAFAVAGGTLSTSISIPGTPTTEVTDRLADEFPEASGGTGTVVLRTEDGSAFTAEQQAQIAERLAEGAEVDGVTAVIDPFVTETQRATQQAELEGGLAQLDQAIAAQGETPELAAQRAGLEMGAALLEMAAETRQVSDDGATALATIAFEDPAFSIPQETKDAVVAVFDEPIDGVTVDLSADITQGIPELFGVGEVIGLLVAAVVLVIMLGTLIGAGLPILTALIGVGIGALGALSLSGVVEMVSVTPVLGLMLGLAVGIDYSLFIINRHRRQLKQGEDLHESIGLANGTSGNAVVFAGATVLIALLALNITGIPFLGLMGTVGAFCILVAVLIAVTLTPALLGLVGTRILSRKERAALAAGTENGATPAAPAAPQPMSTARAIGRVVIGIAALVIIALPALDLRLNLPDGSSEPSDSTQYRAYTTIAEEFGEGRNGPLLVVADLPEGTTEEEAMLAQVEVGQALFAQDDVVAVAPIGTSEDFGVVAFQVVPADGPTSESTETLVHTLRAASPLEGTYEIGVAGSASGNIDISDKLAGALPIYLAVVVGLSLIILILVFRSIFVPVIATLGFILSYFAALGGVVAIYQWGWLAPVFGVDTPGPILNFLPTILVGILFGLAMDYMLFLGSGMREAYAHGAPARVAVVQGVRAGRTVVTAAAIIMISVFGGFVFSHSAMIRPIGFALAFGVLVDAFVVRMLIIPALMHLAGDKAWWLPRWLDRILPDVDVEGAKLERRHGHGAEASDIPAGSEAADGGAGSEREGAAVSG